MPNTEKHNRTKEDDFDRQGRQDTQHDAPDDRQPYDRAEQQQRQQQGGRRTDQGQDRR